jgi:hypothetical protein
MRHIKGKVIATIVVCAGLGGCQTLGEITGTSRDTSGSARPVPSSDAPAAAVLPTRQGPPAAALSGLDASQLLSLWGEPTVRRREAGAELWTYGKPRAGCTVLVYLYTDAGGAMTVVRSEALPGGTDAGVVAKCARANGLSPTS